MKKISVDQAEDKKCKEISTQDEIMSFLGWKDSYKNQKSKIILKLFYCLLLKNVLFLMIMRYI